MLEKVNHPVYGDIDLCGFPIKVSEAELKVLSGCPELGHDTEIVMKELLGYSNTKIDRLRKRGAIL